MHYKKVMRMKLKRHCLRTDQTYISEYDDLITESVEYFKQIGFLNDEGYLSGMIQSLFRRGSSSQKIRAKLMGKGFDSHTISQALENFSEEQTEHFDDAISIDLLAGIKFCKKKRLACFDPFIDDKKEDHDHKQKFMRKLAYQGYSYGIIKTLWDIDEEEALAKLNNIA